MERLKKEAAGGSISAGYGVSKGYVDIITESLLPKGIKVINRSRFKETTFDGIGTFSEDMVTNLLTPEMQNSIRGGRGQIDIQLFKMVEYLPDNIW